MRTALRTGLFLAGLAVVGSAGCGGEGGHQLSGTVTYDGKPVPKGSITITPDEGNTGQAVTAEIVDGKFTTPDDKGHSGGKYKLRINGYDGQPVPSGEGGQDPLGTPLFEGYEKVVDLPEDDHTLEVSIPKTEARPRVPSGEGP